jgi:hypothetical protein
MCRVPIPSGYSLANVYKGFLCFVHGYCPKAPALLCNPVTGKTKKLERIYICPGIQYVYQ